MTSTTFKISLLTALTVLSTGCCFLHSPQERFEPPNRTLRQFEGEKMAEFVSNKIYTSLIMSEPLLQDYEAQVYFKPFQQKSEFTKQLNLYLARKNRITFVNGFSSFTLVGESLKVLKGRVHVKMYMKKEGATVWNYEKDFELIR